MYLFLLIYTFRGRKSAKSSIDLPAGQNVQFPSLLQLNGMICSIFSRNDIISIACYLHRKNISLFATTQTSQAPGNLTEGSGSYQICSSDVEWPAVCAICMPPSTYGLLLHSAREELLQNTGPYISPACETGDLLLENVLLENRRVYRLMGKSIKLQHSLLPFSSLWGKSTSVTE